MKPPELVAPPVWADADFERERRISIDRFVAERKASGNAPYLAAFADRLPFVRQFFVDTDDLATLTSADAMKSADGVLAARYLAAPIISADDLDTLTGTRVAHRKRIPADMARQAAETVMAFIDPVRFPWVTTAGVRAPSAREREIAICWTAGMLAARDVSTGRRGESATRQEASVANLLRKAGYKQVPSRPLRLVDDLKRGTFSREASVLGQKCDVPIRLRDGRLLLIECKVSNSGTNSVKRLVREVGGKAPDWRNNIGHSQCFVAAVLAGAYTMQSLKTARDEKNVHIFWEHDLTPLEAFLSAAR